MLTYVPGGTNQHMSPVALTNALHHLHPITLHRVEERAVVCCRYSEVLHYAVFHPFSSIQFRPNSACSKGSLISLEFNFCCKSGRVVEVHESIRRSPAGHLTPCIDYKSSHDSTFSYILPCTPIYPHILIYTHIYSHILIYTPIYSYILIYTPIY